MDKLSKLAFGLAVLALVVGVFAFFKTPTVLTNTVEKLVGGVSSDSSHKFFGDGITVGGHYLATTTGVTLSTYTLTAVELTNKTVLAINNSHDITISLGATSTASLVPNVGDTAELYIRNASTTAAAAITFAAADSSTDLQYAEATGGDLVLSGLDWEKVTLIRNALSGVSQVTVILDEMTEAD